MKKNKQKHKDVLVRENNTELCLTFISCQVQAQVKT